MHMNSSFTTYDRENNPDLTENLTLSLCYFRAVRYMYITYYNCIFYILHTYLYIRVHYAGSTAVACGRKV
jgi:hypothetical protein